MEQQIVRQVLLHLKRGDKVLLRRGHAGSSRIKIKHGIMNSRTKRFSVDRNTFEAVRLAIKNATDPAGRADL